MSDQHKSKRLPHDKFAPLCGNGPTLSYTARDEYSFHWNYVSCPECLKQRPLSVDELTIQLAQKDAEIKDLTEKLERQTNRAENESRIRQDYVSRCMQKDAEIERLRGAIKEIAPWLSASLDGTQCTGYESACNAIFAIDLEELSERNKEKG